MASQDWTDFGNAMGVQPRVPETRLFGERPVDEGAPDRASVVLASEPFVLDHDLADLAFPIAVDRTARTRSQIPHAQAAPDDQAPPLIFCGSKHRSPEAFLDTATFTRPLPTK